MTVPSNASADNAKIRCFIWCFPLLRAQTIPNRTFRFRLSHICRTALERDRPAALSAHSGIHAHGAAEGGAADCPAFSNVEEKVL